jgi:hypothetical protein
VPANVLSTGRTCACTRTYRLMRCPSPCAYHDRTKQKFAWPPSAQGMACVPCLLPLGSARSLVGHCARAEHASRRRVRLMDCTSSPSHHVLLGRTPRHLTRRCCARTSLLFTYYFINSNESASASTKSVFFITSFGVFAG